MSKSYEEQGQDLGALMEDRMGKYGDQYSEARNNKLQAGLVKKINNYVSGRGILTYDDVQYWVMFTWRKSSRIHKSRR